MKYIRDWVYCFERTQKHMHRQPTPCNMKYEYEYEYLYHQYLHREQHLSLRKSSFVGFVNVIYKAKESRNSFCSVFFSIIFAFECICWIGVHPKSFFDSFMFSFLLFLYFFFFLLLFEMLNICWVLRATCCCSLWLLYNPLFFFVCFIARFLGNQITTNHHNVLATIAVFFFFFCFG